MASATVATSAAAERLAIASWRNAGRADVTLVTGTPGTVRSAGRWRQMLGWLDDAVLLLMLALAFPVAILVVGTPIALAVRLLVEIGRRLN